MTTIFTSKHSLNKIMSQKRARAWVGWEGVQPRNLYHRVRHCMLFNHNIFQGELDGPRGEAFWWFYRKVFYFDQENPNTLELGSVGEIQGNKNIQISDIRGRDNLITVRFLHGTEQGSNNYIDFEQILPITEFILCIWSSFLQSSALTSRISSSFSSHCFINSFNC